MELKVDLNKLSKAHHSLMIGIKNIVFNFLVVGFEPKVDLVNLLLFAVTCVNAVVIDVFRNIISDWLTQFHPSSEG